MGAVVRILVMRHASFYAPLICTVAGGFLEAQGISGTYQVRPPDRDPFDMLLGGKVDIMQSAVSSNWARMEKGIEGLPVHFGRINRRDGFWLLGREERGFEWAGLEGRVVLTDHGLQPLAMLRYAAAENGVNLNRVEWLNVGEADDIVNAWRSGTGDFAHLQGPVPHQLALEGLGAVVGSVGQAMPEVAFSSIASNASYLATPDARRFMVAYRECLEWIAASTAEEISACMAPFFEAVDPEALTASIRGYKSLGCWARTPAIPNDEYEQALDVFQWNRSITKRHSYQEVVIDPWQ